MYNKGEYICSGKNGSCCTEGGIGEEFKAYLLNLLEKYELPAGREAILDFN